MKILIYIFKFTLYFNILLLFIFSNDVHSFTYKCFELKLKDNKKNELLIYSKDNKNIESKLFLGVGDEINFLHESKSHLLLSVDFTLLLPKLFFIEASYDYNLNDADLISIVPGFYFKIYNIKSVFFLRTGFGILRGALLFVPVFKYDYNISNNYELGFELKTPLGSKNISQLHMNFNFVINLK